MRNLAQGSLKRKLVTTTAFKNSSCWWVPFHTGLCTLHMPSFSLKIVFSSVLPHPSTLTSSHIQEVKTSEFRTATGSRYSTSLLSGRLWLTFWGIRHDRSWLDNGCGCGHDVDVIFCRIGLESSTSRRLLVVACPQRVGWNVSTPHFQGGSPIPPWL